MSVVKDATGQQTETWSSIGSAYARVAPLRGREYLAASGEKANLTHEVTLRARNDVALMPRDRVLFGTRLFDIQSVINVDERDRQWSLMCVEQLHTTDDG